MENKILSIVITARNDDYNPFFLNRLRYNIENSFFQINRLNLPDFLDYIIVDWGSNNPIRKNINLSKLSSEKVNFLEVDNDLSKLNGTKVNNFFHTTESYNVGIRRSTSKFISLGSHDVLFSSNSLFNLYHILKNKNLSHYDISSNFLTMPRYNLPYDLFYKPPDFLFLDKWIVGSKELNYDVNSKIVGGSQGGFLASKEYWTEMMGVNEIFKGYGYLDQDMHLRASMIGKCINGGKFNIHTYKMPRGSANKRLSYVLNMNLPYTSLSPTENNNNWGLNEYQIPFKKYQYNKKEIKNFDVLDKKAENNRLNFFNNISLSKNVFFTSARLRLIFFSFLNYRIIYLLYKYLNLKEIRHVAEIGMDSLQLFPFLSLLNKSTNFETIDDLEFVASKNNDKELNQNLGFFRAFNVGMQFALNHKSKGDYFYSNQISRKSINNLFKELPTQKNSTIIIIRDNYFNKKFIEKIIEEILNNKDKISSILFIYKSQHPQNYQSSFKRLNGFSIKKINKITLLINENNQENLIKNNIESLSFDLVINFIFTNIVLVNINILRLLISIFKRIRKILGFRLLP